MRTILFLFLIVVLSACANNGLAQNITITPRAATLTPEPTRNPTLTPTPEPLGSQSNPFVVGVVSTSEDPLVPAATEELARRIAASMGKTVIARVFPTYEALLEAMEEGQVHITWLPPLTYLYASRRGLAEVVMLTNHFGVYQYGAQFLANVESEFTPYFDPISGFTSVEAATALAQFAGTRPCYVEPLSPSGYIVPAGLLAAQSVETTAPVFIQSHTAVVRALYIKGICDFGVTFSISGDPRTDSQVINDLPDTLNRVLIIWRTDPIIPNINLSFLPGISERDRQELINAIVAIARTAEGKALLSTTADNYQIDDLSGVDDNIYDPLRRTVDALNLNLTDLIGR